MTPNKNLFLNGALLVFGFFAGALVNERPQPFCFSPQDGLVGRIEEANSVLVLFDNNAGNPITLLPLTEKAELKKMKQVSCKP